MITKGHASPHKTIAIALGEGPASDAIMPINIITGISGETRMHTTVITISHRFVIRRSSDGPDAVAAAVLMVVFIDAHSTEPYRTRAA